MKCHYIFLLLTLMLSGCSAEWHLTRAIKKDPTILTQKEVIVRDTIVTKPVVVKDTVTLSKTDTIEIVKDRFRVKIMRSYDTLIIDGGCDADTIYRTISVPVPQIAVRETRMQKIQRHTFWGLVSLLFIAIAIIIIRKSVWLK